MVFLVVGCASLRGPRATLGGPRTVRGGSLGGLEASLGISVSATDSFVIVTDKDRCLCHLLSGRRGVRRVAVCAWRVWPGVS